MATSTVTGRVHNPARTPYVGLPVLATLTPAGVVYGADGSVIAATAQTTTGVDGSWSLSLERTDTATPAGEHYNITCLPTTAMGAQTAGVTQRIALPAGGGTLQALLA